MVKLGKGQREKRTGNNRILLFYQRLRKGGSERVLVNLAEYLKDNGVEVTVVTQYEGQGNTLCRPVSGVYSARLRRRRRAGAGW